MALKNLKKGAVVCAMAFAAAVLTGCKEDTPAPGNSSATTETRLDPQFHVTFDDIAIRTAIGREVRVSVSAYCTPLIGRSRTVTEEYRTACRAAIGERMLYAARHENGSVSHFETFLPMGSAEIRPYNMFTPDMMLRAAAHHRDMNIFTVTDVHDCHTGERTPMLNPDAPAPAGGWPSAEERKAAQSVKPAVGSAVGGACRF